MFFSIDRKVGERAVLIGQDGKPLEVPLAMLPQDAKEGDMLFHGKDGFTLAPDKTNERRSRMAGMLGMLLRTEDEPDGE